MTNLSVTEKLALEEVFECLKDKHCRKIRFTGKHLVFYRMVKIVRRFFFVRR